MNTKLAMGILAISVAVTTGAAGIAAASARPGGTQPEHLRIMSTKATSDRLSAIATGAFTAGGYDIPARVTDTVVFPAGTFRFRHVTHSASESFNIRTCLLTETQKGTFTIGHGTGRYARIHGSGKFTDSIVAVTAKNRMGKCTHVETPATFQQITSASGMVSR